MTQYWRLPYNPDGYPEESFDIDTTGAKVGDVIYLKHSYFLGGSVKASIGGVGLTVSDADPKADLILTQYDSNLTTGAKGNKVYGALQINKARCKNVLITILASYVVDFVDPADFEQRLRPDSDVEFGSIKTGNIKAVKVTADIGKFKDSLVVADNLLVDSDTFKVKTDKANIAGVGISSGGVKIDGEADFSIGNDKNRIIYKDGAYYVWNEGTNEKVPLIALYRKEVNPGTIPVVSSADGRKVEVDEKFFYDWEKQTIHAEGFKGDSANFKDLKTQEVSIGKFKFSVDQNGNLRIGDNLVLEEESGDIIISGQRFNFDFLNRLEVLISDVQELKKR